MVTFIPRAQSNSDRFAKAFSNLGQTASQLIPEELMGRQERKSLSTLSGEDLSDVRNPDFQKMILSESLKKRSIENDYQADSANYNKVKQAFGSKFADLWLATGQGERTALTKAALEARGRGIDLDQILGVQEAHSEVAEKEQPQKTPEESVFQKLNEFQESQDEGLLPSEKIARGKERYTTGLKEYQEASTKLKSSARDKERFDILESLNKSEKLPKGLGRLNVDKEGNLRLPFLGSAEAQRYVKVLNEFSSGAKDTFGSRVTNFDLAQYLKRYPTLLNTEEGRRQLIDQMKIVNQINSLYYKNLKNIYDKAGGVRNIDSDVAERFAEELSEGKISELTKKFNKIGEFTSKPSASEFKGEKIVDENTGEIFLSDGKNWVPEGQ